MKGPQYNTLKENISQLWWALFLSEDLGGQGCTKRATEQHMRLKKLSKNPLEPIHGNLRETLRKLMALGKWPWIAWWQIQPMGVSWEIQFSEKLALGKGPLFMISFDMVSCENTSFYSLERVHSLLKG